MAWDHWYAQLLEPSTDWRMINSRLKAFVEAEKSLASPANLAILRSLDAALTPSKAKPASIAALIDDLMDCKSTNVDVNASTADPRYLKLVLAGFAAVPELVEHLEDDRLTRTQFIGFNNFPGYHCRVKHLVSGLLQGLAGQDLGKDWVRRFQGYPVQRADAMKWWKTAQKVGEENYLVKNVLSSGPQGKWPNEHQLRMIADKYPDRLPQVYRALLDERPKMKSWPLAEAIARSNLPRDKKVEVLIYGSSQTSLTHREAALWQLKELDKETSVQKLIEALERLPASPTEPYWRCPERECAALVRDMDDSRAWQALLKAAKRADVSLRMEYLGAMSEAKGTTQQRWQRAKFLAEFLDDTAVRDVKGRAGMFEGFYAGWVFPRIEVRNFATLEIVSQLELMVDLPVDRFTASAKPWTPEQWSKLRNQVREALKGRP
jgi:hypothetical protein